MEGGAYVYETKTGSRGLIEQEVAEAGHSRIQVRTQRGQAVALLHKLVTLVEEEQNLAGMTPIAFTTSAPQRDRRNPGAAVSAELLEKMSFAQEPSPKPEWCVSYAWKDDTPEGREREAIVDRLCDEAEARGQSILRDKNVMGLGERISKFMRRIGRADRVFVVLSDKYLKSPFCMFELCEVWRNSRQEDDELLHRIRVFTLPCARIWTPLDQIKYAVYWKKQYDEMEALVSEHGYDVLGEHDAQQFRRMKEFCRNVGDILAAVADTLQPRSFDDLVKYGFADGPPAAVRSDAS